MITFYDLAGKAPIKCWSPNPWKIRYVLNMKKLPYKTIYVQMQDINRVIKEAGIPSSYNKRDGTPGYTIPSIIDHSTGAAITESYKIAEYLDTQYPDTPKAFPAGTEALQAVFYHYWNGRKYDLVSLITPSIPRILNESNLERFHTSRKGMFGKPVDEIRPVGEELEKTWTRLSELFNNLEEWYEESSGRFLVGGDQASFGDFVVAGMINAVKIICGEESEDWKRLSNMNEGRWVKLLGDLEEHASIEN